MFETPSPLAEGRELKLRNLYSVMCLCWSPLAEGRELKLRILCLHSRSFPSPLAEGRELKWERNLTILNSAIRRPSRRGVN